MKQSILYAAISAFLTVLLITAAPAFAQTPAGRSGAQVSFVPTADLDLRTEAGQRQLRQRVAQAAREVCGVASDADLQGKNEVRRCRDEAMVRGLEQSQVLMAAGEQGAKVAVTAAR